MTDELRSLVAISENPNMYSEVLKTLYSLLKDKEELNVELRRGLVKNPNCPVDVLEKLCKDEMTDIRVSAAAHRRATEKMLAGCVKDESVDVRLTAVKNPNVAEDTVISFMKDSDETVVKTARAILKQRL